jgi:hypothetical protein
VPWRAALLLGAWRVTDEEIEGLRKTLFILHWLAEMGVLEQRIGADGTIRWHALKGSKAKLAKAKQALKAYDILFGDK